MAMVFDLLNLMGDLLLLSTLTGVSKQLAMEHFDSSLLFLTGE